MSHETAFAKLSACLNRALEASTLEESRQFVADAIQRTNRLTKAVATDAIKRGRKGGSKTAERGPDYFRQIAAMRKTRAGGRPRESPTEGPNPGEVARWVSTRVGSQQKDSFCR